MALLSLITLSMAVASAMAQTVTTDNTAYQLGEEVVVNWNGVTDAIGQVGDWVAIYKTGENDANGVPDASQMWVYMQTLDQEDENGEQNAKPTEAGSVILNSPDLPEEDDEASYPLPPGSYMVHLIRNGDDEPYAVYASSAAFTVDSTEKIAPSDSSMTVYAPGEPIEFVWYDPDISADGWIGIYPASALSNGMVGDADEENWAYANNPTYKSVGAVALKYPNMTGVITFDGNHSGIDFEDGEYQIHIIDDGEDEGPFTVSLSSEVFTVATPSESPSEAPSTSPAPTAPTASPAPSDMPSPSPSASPSSTPTAILACADQGLDCAFSDSVSFTSLCVQKTKTAKKGGATVTYQNKCVESSTIADLEPGATLGNGEVIHDCGCCSDAALGAKDEDFCSAPVCTPSDASFSVCKTEKSNGVVKIDACVTKAGKKGSDAVTLENKCVDPFDATIKSCGACPV